MPVEERKYERIALPSEYRVGEIVPWFWGEGGEKESGTLHESSRRRGKKESQRIVFVIKLTRMGLINLCESIKQVL